MQDYSVFPHHLFPQVYRYYRQTNCVKKRLSRYSWREIVHLYSGYKLTFGHDKLIAVSGLARLLNNTLGSQFLAGIWKKDERDLLMQLLWTCHETARIHRVCRPLEYRGPTWSWVSIDTRVNLRQVWKDQDKAHHAQIISERVTLSGEDCFGAVSAAVLKLRCEILISLQDCLRKPSAQISSYSHFYLRVPNEGPASAQFDTSDENDGPFYMFHF